MNVFIISSDSVGVEQSWVLWLAQQIEKVGNHYEIINLPQSCPPNFMLWKQSLSMHLHSVNDQTIIIAHSLACLSVLDYLSDALNGRILKAIFLVAGFSEPLNTLPELNQFIQHAKLNDALIRFRIQQRYLFFSNNDPFIPAPWSIRFGQLVNAQMNEIKQASHFTQKDGFTEFPQLWEKLEKLLMNEQPKKDKGQE